jgi:hypothetical protein
MHNNTWLSLANDCNSKLKKTIAFQKNDKPMILKNKSFPILNFDYMNGDFQLFPNSYYLQIPLSLQPCQNDLYKHVALFLTGKFLFYLNFYNTQ